MFQSVGKRTRTRTDRDAGAFAQMLQQLAVAVDAFGQHQRCAAESQMIDVGLLKILDGGIELGPGRFNLGRFPRIADDQIRYHQGYALRGRAIELVGKYLHTRRR